MSYTASQVTPRSSFMKFKYDHEINDVIYSFDVKDEGRICYVSYIKMLYLDLSSMIVYLSEPCLYHRSPASDN
jgi:hypothetical protein